jgi:hypothetical protein
MNTMNSIRQAASTTQHATPSTRVAGLGFAAVMTLAMLLGVNTLAQVDTQDAQLAQAAATASAVQS